MDGRGAFTTHTDDVSGCGECDLLAKVRKFSENRSGGVQVQDGSFVHVGMTVSLEKDFSVTSTQADFAKNMKLLPTPPELWAGRKTPLSVVYIKLRQC